MGPPRNAARRTMASGSIDKLKQKPESEEKKGGDFDKVRNEKDRNER